MNERDATAARFEEHRGRLRAVAYRMLGSMADADDAVQEAWVRLDRFAPTAVDNVAGWLTTVVARVPGHAAVAQGPRRAVAPPAIP
jgi:DNA-directed RNA polymerase specialized sigma24 family protein